LPLPRSIDRGSIEAARSRPVLMVNTGHFRDQLIAAPLKRHAETSAPCASRDFRDQLIAAPLKPTKSKLPKEKSHGTSAIN